MAADVNDNAVNLNPTEAEEEDVEQATYLYGCMVALSPGEGAPDFVAHEDVEEADSGWDKIERVNRIAYTTTNQDVAREHGFALLGTDDDGYAACSWGTFDCDLIEMGEYVYKNDDGTEAPIDIYTDEGAQDALEAAGEAAEAYHQAQQHRRAMEKAANDARDARFAELLKAAGIEVSAWSLNIALQAGYHVRDADTRTSRKQSKFSTHYDHMLYDHPAVTAARAQGEMLVREAQAQQARLESAARSRLHAEAQRILDVVRAAEGEVLGLLEQMRQAYAQAVSA
jgi:hypothetical protein